MEKSGENLEDELAEVTILLPLQLVGGAYFQICHRWFLFMPACALLLLEALIILNRLTRGP